MNFYRMHQKMPDIEKSASGYNGKETSQASLLQSNRSLQIQKIIKFLNHQDVIPTTVTPIKVTTIKSPYIMRAYEIQQHTDKLDKIQRKLLSFMKTEEYLRGEYNVQNPKVGDVVIVQSSKCTVEVELPSFVCRGLIQYIKKQDEIYYILLVDHGISIKLTRDKFCIVPQNFIPEKYLTKAVGVFNIMPIRMKKNVSNGSNNSKSTPIVVDEWSEEAIQFAEDLLYESKIIYFDHLHTDEKNGREYGEFYLTINNIDIISLSEALIINYYATYIEGDLLQLVDNYSQSKENIKDHIQIKFSCNDKIEKNRNNARQVNHAQVNYSLKEFCLNEKVLIQSTMNCGILNDVRDLGYPHGIHKGWNEYYKSSRPRKLQSYIWPAINNGLNVVAIGPSQCGKTSGCVMSVCGLVAMRQKEVSHSATRPLALILCSSSSEVINIHSLCMSFLRSFDNVKSVAAFNGKTSISIAASIYKGCQILIATPQYLARFLNENKNLLSFDRLSYLVLDNVDVILDKYYNSIGELFKKHKVIENRESQGDNRPTLQIIISATTWTPEIKKFICLATYKPYICITSFLEAVIFKSIRPQLYILNSIQKNQKISDILKDDYTTMRTMIICINAKEAEELNTFLFSTKKTLLIHEEMKLSDIRALQDSWKACVRSLYPVLICTDAVLSDLNFTNIQWLIHHSVQLKFKNLFNYRFSVLLDHLTQDAKKCKFSIFIDERNDQQFVSIIKLMERMKVVISRDLLKSCDRIAVTLEKDKKEYAICDNVKSFGFCHEKNVCVFRHYMLPKIDAPMTNIQINDKVILMVMYIHDTTHFSARIIEYMSCTNESKKIKFCDTEYMKTALKIQEYYQNVENRKVCISTNVGDICALEESMDTFKRVQIVRIRYDKDSSEDKVKFVDVRCIDSGVIHEAIDVYKLMHIPEELSNLPTHIVEIFLAGVAPPDKEYMWNHCANEAVHKWFSKNFDERSYIIGKVCLHLGNTIWLDDLRIGTKLLGYSDMIGSSLKKELLAKNFAILNDNHMPDLFKLCKNSDMIDINGHDINVMCK
ncbi:putative ATP-dependent RNA helicase TDRD12 isoform X2 [Camponotus floridanus]|uniref:putative ATP-dependent RNA helicase TDRD12 isoform X2 n=1 Tax=Camponotus floridanus TaxID=104421 RepID=UPI000DC6B13F|nr:putative ATP-dependent RNA helicase TDRD12 isoform X2 [Camponotus floridanus]